MKGSELEVDWLPGMRDHRSEYNDSRMGIGTVFFVLCLLAFSFLRISPIYSTCALQNFP